jgi:hypothetical protein
MRILLSVLLASTVSLSLAGPAKSIQAGVVNLDRPGVLEALERDRPDIHRRVLGVLQLARSSPCQMDDFEKVTRVQYDAVNARCGNLVKTSYPAQLQLSFTIEGTRYVSAVVMDRSERLTPATDAR